MCLLAPEEAGCCAFDAREFHKLKSAISVSALAAMLETCGLMCGANPSKQGSLQGKDLAMQNKWASVKVGASLLALLLQFPICI